MPFQFHATVCDPVSDLQSSQNIPPIKPLTLASPPDILLKLVVFSFNASVSFVKYGASSLYPVTPTTITSASAGTVTEKDPVFAADPSYAVTLPVRTIANYVTSTPGHARNNASVRQVPRHSQRCSGSQYRHRRYLDLSSRHLSWEKNNPP